MDFEYKVIVRSYDTDWQGVVNFGRYSRFVSEALEQLYINEFGHDLALFNDVMTVTRRYEIDYLKPLRAGDEARVKLSVNKNGEHSIRVDFQILNQRAELCAKGSKILVFIDKNWTKANIPENVLQLFKDE